MGTAQHSLEGIACSEWSRQARGCSQSDSACRESDDNTGRAQYDHAFVQRGVPLWGATSGERAVKVDNAIFPLFQ